MTPGLGTPLAGDLVSPPEAAAEFDLRSDRVQDSARRTKWDWVLRLVGSAMAVAMGGLILAGLTDPYIGKLQTDVLEGLFLGFGVAIILLTLVRGPRQVATARVDSNAVTLVMDRPPDWRLEWGSLDGWVHFSRGYKPGTPEVDEPKGWILNAKGLWTTVPGPLGRAIVNQAIGRGYRVIRDRSGPITDTLVLEIFTMEAPTMNPVGKHPAFKGGLSEVLTRKLP